MTSTPAGRDLARILGGATTAMGAAFLIWPHALANRFSGGRSTPDNAIVRVLGGRQLLQGAVQVAQPKPDVVLAGVAVDLIHAGSMLVLSVLWPAYRRSALSSAAIAAVSALGGAAVLVTDRE